MQDPKNQKLLIVILVCLLVLMLLALLGLQLWLWLAPGGRGDAVLEDNHINHTQPPGSTGDGAAAEPTAGREPSGSATDPSDGRTETQAPAVRPTTAPTAGPAQPPADQPQAELKFYYGNAAHNRRFEAGGMYPGDTVSQRYSINVSHSHPVNLVFTVTVKEQTRYLGNALMLRITDRTGGTVLCDLPFNEATERYTLPLAADSSQQTILDFQIDAYLDTSVGNEYQRASLLADFCWQVEDASGGGGGLLPPKPGDTPQTGDTSDPVFWVMVMSLSAFGLAVMALRVRKRGIGYEE